VEDYHVDRPGVEVGRPMKLTGTNNPIGLIVSQINSFDYSSLQCPPLAERQCLLAFLHPLG
jgi:hypothetical protein